MNSSGTANENVICVDKLWLNFKAAFLKVADRHAPLIQERVRGVCNNYYRCIKPDKKTKRIEQLQDGGSTTTL